MKLDELYISMASLGDEVRAKIHAMIASPDTQIDQHVKWLADWYNHDLPDARCQRTLE